LELATSSSVCQPGSLTLAAIASVFTITYVAEMLGEDEDWLHELAIDMFPEDGCLRVYGVGEDGVHAQRRRQAQRRRSAGLARRLARTNA
jgi:hypothetical protein